MKSNQKDISQDTEIFSSSHSVTVEPLVIRHGVFAYADPPYLGCGKLYLKHHSKALDWDKLDNHQRLINQLTEEYQDGWAYSLSSVSLQKILPLCPPTVRVGAWVKPFCSFKPNVNPAYAWEPVIFFGGRKRTHEQLTERDWVSANITLKKGLTGAKPEAFCTWLFRMMNLQYGDTLVDLFPGTKAVGNSWKRYKHELWESNILKANTRHRQAVTV